MSPITVIQIVATLLCLGIVSLCITKWHRPRMMYFTCFGIMVFFLSLGYLLELTSPTLEAAVVACKVTYIGSPFIGVFLYLFIRDYCNVPLKRGFLVPVLAVWPLATTVLVFTWPAQRLYYSALAFSTQGGFSHLVVTPGPLYYASFGYSVLLAALGCATLVRYFIRSNSQGRRHSIYFLLAIVVPLAATGLLLTRALPLGYDPVPLTMSLSFTIMYFYLTHYRQREWQSLGREMVVENMKDAFILLDPGLRFLDANAMAAEYFPSLRTIPPGTLASGIEGFPQSILDSAEDDSDFTLVKDGEPLFLRASRSALYVGNSLLGTSVLIYDDTENHCLMDRLQQMATHDALTGLYNRGTFFNFATRDFDLSLRKREEGSVLMMDIDHFKDVNDTYGHACGDKVLTAVSEVLRTRLRRTDIAGRYGGEEIAVWLPGAGAQKAAIVADVIRRAVQHTPFESESGIFNITLSIGVAGLDHNHHHSFEGLLAEADEALYEAKVQGRNMVRTYTRPSPLLTPKA